jgi:hypothetical protein
MDAGAGIEKGFSSIKIGQIKFPTHGWAGLILILIFWPVNWFGTGNRTSWAFFPLWLGYSLTMDALALRQNGTSLFQRSWKKYVGLFLVSMPGWWLFELINQRIQNWYYVGVESLTPLQFFLLSSLNFSVVMPAVFSAAEWASGFGFIQRMKSWLVVRKDFKTTIRYFSAGWVMVGLMLIWPKYFFPLVWVSVYCILEPVNIWFGHRSIADFTETGNWKPVASLFVGVLITGFFWEMWNYFSYPKWIYTVPWVNFGHLFEMPILGYGGYLPFALELFAMYHLFMGFLGERKEAYVLAKLEH